MMMKARLLLFIPAIAGLTLLTSSFFTRETSIPVLSNPAENLVIPDSVDQIFQKSCFGCHNQKSEVEKAKKKLLLDELPDLSKAKIIAKLYDMDSVLTYRKMPPDKFLHKFPDKALSDEEYNVLISWVKTVSAEMLK